MIRPGDRLPTDFELTVVQAGGCRTAAFASLLDRRTVVSVYLRNNTGGCDRQNDALIAVAPELAAAGFNVVAVSRDRAASHLRYAARKDIPYVLASDPEDRFAQAADAIIWKVLYGRKYRGPARCALVLDRDGTVLAVVEKVDPAVHAAQLRQVIASLPGRRPGARKGPRSPGSPAVQ